MDLEWRITTQKNASGNWELDAELWATRAESNGFSRSGAFKAYWRIDGVWHDDEGVFVMPAAATEEPCGVSLHYEFDPADFPFGVTGEDWHTACDIDGDGHPNSTDGDIDDDGLPNSSDGDDDGDGIPDEDDPFPQGDPVCGGGDMDGDGVGNCDDGDVDGDGIVNSEDDDDDGDGIPDVDDDTPRGQDCTEQEPEPADPPNWWDPPPNVIDSNTIIVFPPGDIDGDGIPNNLDDDADGDGIPNYGDDDADGDGVADNEVPPTGEPTPAPEPPIVVPPSYPIVPTPPTYPDPPAEGDCDPCYWLEVIATELQYQNRTGDYTPTEGEEPYTPNIPTSQPDTSWIDLPDFGVPDFGEGTPLEFYIPFELPGQGDSRQRISMDMTRNAAWFTEIGSAPWETMEFIRQVIRLFTLVWLLWAFVQHTAAMLYSM